MRIKDVVCNLCGNNQTKNLVACKIEKQDADIPIGYMQIVKCVNCGLVYVNPRPVYSPEEINKLYSDNYFDAPYMRFYIEKGDMQTNESFSSRLDWIEQFKKKGRILDIGGASGGFLRIAQKRGWEVFGIEISKAAADIAREKYGLNVITGRVEEAGYKSNFFDVVSVSDVLEHIENPKEFLFKVNKIMKRGGLLYIAVPDFDGLYYKAAISLSNFNHKNYFVLPHHIYFFNKITIARYFKETNFNVIDVKKSEANILTKGFKGKIMWFLFFIARLSNMQDRILFLAEKRNN